MVQEQGQPEEPRSSPGRSLSYWISETLRSARENARIRPDDLARILNVNPKTIERLERDESFDRHIDRYLAGYAYAIGLEDARQLWEMALQRWYKHGAAPEFKPPEGPAEAFARAIRETAQRQLRVPDAHNGTPRATRKRRASP